MPPRTKPDVRQLQREAGKTLGVFSLPTALAAGYSYKTVRSRAQTGEWQEMRPRVFRVADGTPPTFPQRAMAEVLFTGGRAGGVACLALLGVVDPPAVPDILMAPARRSSRHRGSAVYFTRCLPMSDLATIGGVPGLTPVRALLEACARMPELESRQAFERLLTRRIVRAEVLRARAAELVAPNRRGPRAVLDLMDECAERVGNARSVWEALVSRAIADLGLPSPCMNFPIRIGNRRYVIDIAWPDVPGRPVAVEFDGFEWHALYERFNGDRARRNDLESANWRVFNLTASLVADPAAALADIAVAVGGGARTWAAAR